MPRRADRLIGSVHGGKRLVERRAAYLGGLALDLGWLVLPAVQPRVTRGVVCRAGVIVVLLQLRDQLLKGLLVRHGGWCLLWTLPVGRVGPPPPYRSRLW